MRRLSILALLLLAALLPAPASAHHSAGGGADCGVREWDGVAGMTKGRTDGMVYSVDHTVGCKRVVLRNLVGTGIGESYGYPGQRETCVRYGREDAANVFRYYFDVEVDPASIAVVCSRYSGAD